MKNLIYSILLLLCVGVTGCKEDDAIKELILDETDLTLIQGKSVTLDIFGNGRYIVDVENPDIVSTWLAVTKITFVANAIGTTNVTITDRLSESKTIRISVIQDKESVISFDVANTDQEKKGNYGFLHSIKLDAPLDSFVTLIKPKLWRVGRYNQPFQLYHRLKGLGVERQLIAVSDFTTEEPYRTIFQTEGYGAMTRALINDTKAMGIEYEWDIRNEPNRATNYTFERFMEEEWNPAYHVIREMLPDAIIHGPSLSIDPSRTPLQDSLIMYEFLERAIADNTLPDYINWHIQNGPNIADWHMSYSNQIKQYIGSKGQSVKGFNCGESIRPGLERNTSPAKLVDMFLADEVGDIEQIRATWTNANLYGISTSVLPILSGILSGKNGEGRRGAWWTYRFFAETEGVRIVCEETPTGPKNMVGIAFKDEDKKVIRAIVGLRENRKKQDTWIRFNNLNLSPSFITNDKVHIKMWYNYQTLDNVSYFGKENLPLILDEVVEITDNSIEIPIAIAEWDAVLIELSVAQ